jgi:hypothetical protein
MTTFVIDAVEESRLRLDGHTGRQQDDVSAICHAEQARDKI